MRMLSERIKGGKSERIVMIKHVLLAQRERST